MGILTPSEALGVFPGTSMFLGGEWWLMLRRGDATRED